MERISVLDHGYIEFIEHWGSDERIVEAARMSTGKGFLGWDHKPDCQIHRLYFRDIMPPDCSCDGQGDEKLLAYLHDNKHTTPFEMAGLVIEVQAPIMVFREWHRHRTQSYNEMSARYIPLPDVNYVPTVERLMFNSKTNKQAGTIKGAEELTDAEAALALKELREEYVRQEALYQRQLRRGIPKELARVHIGVGRYSRMRASANLLNWLKFLTLRMDTKAQYEIRVYANEVGKFVAEKFPRTWELFDASRAK